MEFEFRILGPLEVIADGHPVAVGRSQRRAVLALLLACAGESVSAARIVDELWGEQPSPSAAHAVQVHVSAIRKLLDGVSASAGVVRTAGGYALRVDAERIDARRFAALIAAGSDASRSDAAAAVGLFERALVLWRGSPLVEFAEFAFAKEHAGRCESLRAVAIEGLTEARIGCREYPEAIAAISRLVSEDPLRERPQRLLMLALYRAGRHADALAAYRRACAALDEIGLEPGPELRALEQAVLRHDPALRPAASAPAEPQVLGQRPELIAPAAPGVTAATGTGTGLRGHAIVVGLGSGGRRLARGLHAAGYPVCAIELDRASDTRAEFLAGGVAVVAGDGTDPVVLGEAGIAEARYVIAVCGNDAVNLAVTAAAEATVRTDRPIVLTAFAHVTDYLLLRRLRSETIRGSRSGDFRLEFFNAYAAGSQLLLERHPPFHTANGSPIEQPHICIVGRHPVATHLVLQIAARWDHERSNENRLAMLLAGPEADQQLTELVTCHPQLHRICDMQARTAQIASAAFQSGRVLTDPDGRCAVTAVYVATGSDTDALPAALGLHGHPATETVPILIALEHDTSPIARALAVSGRAFAEHVDTFAVLSAALAPPLLFGGVNELLARANHQTYLREQHAAGITGGPSIRPWDELPESLKNSNRRFADGIGVAVRAVGCAVVPATLIDADRTLRSFTDQQIERLARLEHDRWTADMTRDGWRYHRGEKDPEQKLHPLLVGWDELNAADRDKDRDAARAIPRILAHAGFDVIPRCTTATEQPTAT